MAENSELARVSHAAARESRSRAPSTWRATLLVASKEIHASFRDRQTTLYTVVLPIALYPFLFWCLIQGTLFVQGRREHTEVDVGIAFAREAAAASHVGLDAADRASDEPQRRLVRALETPPAANDASIGEVERAARIQVERVHVTQVRPNVDEAGARAWAASADASAPDAVLWLPALDDPQGAAKPPPSDALGGSSGASAPSAEVDDAQRAAIFYDSTRTASELARKRVAERLPPLAEDLRHAQLPPSRSPADLVPFQSKDAVDVAPGREQGAYLLSFLLPMLLVFMTVMGAFFPAVDLTAGERERNTAETTLLLPVPRLAVHQGKILAVCAGAVIATVLNLFALALSAGHLVHMIARGSKVQFDVPIGAFLAMAPLALLFAFFVSAALTGIASLARTFKEGQALLGPVQMVFIVPAMASGIPGLELTPKLALVPVVNVVLAFRGLIGGRSMPLEYAITGATMLVAALLAIWIAVKLLARESIVSPASAAGLGGWRRWLGKGLGAKGAA